MIKHDYDKKFTRLMIIWQRLREGEILSVKELAKEFNVSTKTIQRDFNERLVDKFPIEKTGHKWKVKKGFSIDKHLSFEEDLVLDVLKELSSSMGNNFFSKASSLFSKIQNSHETSIYSKISIDDISEKTDLIEKIQEAIRSSLQLEFSYKDKYRFTQAYKIANFDGYWYLYAKDILDDRFKTYQIKEIDSLTISDKKFIKDEKAILRLHGAINAWFEPNSELFEIILYIKSNISKYFLNRPLNKYQGVIKKHKNDDIEISLFVTSNKEIIHEIKKWQPDISVISPSSLAKELIRINQDALKNQIDLILE